MNLNDKTLGAGAGLRTVEAPCTVKVMNLDTNKPMEVKLTRDRKFPGAVAKAVLHHDLGEVVIVETLQGATVPFQIIEIEPINE